MNKRFIMAMLVATGMISGFAAVVIPDTQATAPTVAATQIIESQPAAAASQPVRSVIAIKNQAWPPAGRITVEPCSVAQCRDV
ncbi:hypothetical protein FHS85_001460 [Rhodoligotrophos appendicifer]|uniref:hypothetical protein n=1 Tax=Rhodoligotrophos appendicifer TaxID=987056 RepID=UPI001184B86D|nr:hypothetical protein [Rhodoligotrophos appendicifer]